MTKRMLIDATHPEETRVVVLEGQALEHFDVETSTRRLLKGNIYLAKVIRVEPSLQAAFVEYGGGRHGFLAFDEIHPDYYQIPVADRQRLMEEVARQAAEDEEDEPRPPRREGRREAAQPLAIDRPTVTEAVAHAQPEASLPAGDPPAPPPSEPVEPPEPDLPPPVEEPPGEQGPPIGAPMTAEAGGEAALGWTAGVLDVPDAQAPMVAPAIAEPPTETMDHAEIARAPEPEEDPRGPEPEELGGSDRPEPEQVGGDEASEVRPRKTRSLRSYTIQEVVRRRQIMLVQVTKEERGGKGAALTTYVSLAGRYSVLMPNSPRGGGVSRKITSAADRRRLKEVTAESGLPDGMSLIIRTAGAARPKAEIARDIDYLLRTWDDIRETTLSSVAPALIHEEASLIKRAIRDIYARDFEDILVDGQDGWRAARQFINTLIPGHAKKVQLWREPQKLFAKFAVDAQLDAIMQPRVQLRSGGYLVINQTEALVAIDVNSGRSTRERNIEETAFRTNCEAAEEVARQLRLRDLAGLIVIDFIDMENRKNVGTVERRLKDALHDDRARIQVGNISHFGLMEMSRQRLRPSVTEQSAAPCPHCAGTGHIRSTESAAIAVLRQIEDEGAKKRAGEIVCHVATTVALYLLNNMRDRVADIERRFAMRVLFSGDDALIPPEIRIDRTRPPVIGGDHALPPPVSDAEAFEDEAIEAEDVVLDEEEDAPAAEAETDEAGQDRRRKRRRRGRGRRDEAGAEPASPPDATHYPVGEQLAADAAAETADEAMGADDPGSAEGAADAAGDPASESPAERDRRRRRRGGRRRRRDGASADVSAPDAEQPDVPDLSDPRGIPSGKSAYRGPTPADPFNNVPFDIFDVMEQAEARHEAMLRTSAPMAAEVAAAALPPFEGALEAAPEPAVPDLAVSDLAVSDLAEPEPAAEAPPAAYQAEPAPAMPEPERVRILPPVIADAIHLASSPLPTDPPPTDPLPTDPLQAAPPPGPVEGPKVQPVLVDALDEGAPRKRGWWRR